MVVAIITRQGSRAREPRRAIDKGCVGHHADRREQHVGVRFIHHDQLPAAANVERRCPGGHGGPVIVMGAGQARRQLPDGAVDRAFGDGGAFGGISGSDREQRDQTRQYPAQHRWLRIIEGGSMPLYAGMTVNESLVVSGQIAAWDEAVIGRDRARMIEILMAVELTAEQAAFTTDTTLGNPAKY